MTSADEIRQQFVDLVKQRDPDQPLFLQAVDEVVESLLPVFQKHPKYIGVMKVLLEPERLIQFRVPWIDREGNIQMNRGWRVQFNSAIGGYKGGLRLHPSVKLDTLKFLAFEQTFKNALTTLPMGGGKGGSDFDPKGKTDSEVRNFCQSFMTELYRHIGPNTDVPAGDIGVGGREVGFLYGQYRRITNTFTGTMTGKGATFGGSNIRPEATGYGTVYFWQNYMTWKGSEVKGQRVCVSGSGNVAQYAVEKLMQIGAIPITVSDSGGYILEEDGFTPEKLAKLMELKNVKRGRLSEFPAMSPSAKYIPGERPWGVKCDWAIPCATQNEISEENANALLKNGCKGVFEGANMPSTAEAITVYEKNNMAFAPGKAANAGGVAVSGLEMTQNAAKMSWKREQVDDHLQEIMKDIFENCVQTAEEYGLSGNLKAGANIAGFLKVADAMIQQGQCDAKL
eukprot:TRINITY_DN66901_c3_g2_i1.p1 TRINITY_DN66901_c3_g2~~TRINITY_DN66901_c3_g2_i1.p1  ORF type:complete len:479 (+),score=67.58 TRINITY_DN66901_c3_g2_i1:79-1437(+)